ncbi:MAG: hypothetical protein PHU51_01560 [Candidatus Nanoarchaeia archaeon]|nr:hypothetical protein [Candidatus Nanoarchaeia archaeon]
MWFESFGYNYSPFTIKPLKEKTSLIGREKELQDALYFLHTGSMVFVQCEKGNGRTRFLKAIIDEFPGRIIYVDSNKLKKNLDIEELLIRKNGLFGKMFSKLPQEMILLVDNVENLSPVNLERLKFFFDQNNLRSVIFTGDSFKNSNLPDCIKHRIGNKIISLRSLSNDDVKALILERLEFEDGQSFFPSDLVIEVYQKYGNNLKDLLIYSELAATKMVEEGKEKLTSEHFKNLKQEFNIMKYVDESLIDEDGTTIVKVGNYYRNPYKDVFCSVCGAIVSFDEAVCPECGSKFEKEKKEKIKTQPKKKKTNTSKKPKKVKK